MITQWKIGVFQLVVCGSKSLAAKSSSAEQEYTIGLKPLYSLIQWCFARSALAVA